MKSTILLISFVLGFTVFGLAQDFIFSDTICIMDNAEMEFPIYVQGYNANQIVTNEESSFMIICANLEHSYLGDLYIDVKCPNGQQASIHEYYACNYSFLGEPNQSDNCNPGVGYDYCWTMDASNSITDICESGIIVPSGIYMPLNSFDSLVGCPMNGTWSLVINDNWTGDDGTLFNWSLDFMQQPHNGGVLIGTVFSDINGNDTYDAEVDYLLPDIIIKAEPGPYYGISDNSGQYHIFVDTEIDNYSVSSMYYSEIWNLAFPEETFYSISFGDEDTISGLDFAYIADSYCPDLEVDINLNSIILCDDTYAIISYQNNGTLESENTTITVELDDYLEYVFGDHFISQDDNILTFYIGNVSVGESGYFNIVLNAICNEEFLGATACVKAHIYPDEPCEETDAEWDRSSVVVEGECVGDSLICFTITNTGDPVEGDMQGFSDYQLYQDNVLVENGTFKLEGGESIEMCWPATGMTLRLEADQRPGHPGNSHPQESIELCGSPSNSTGQISVISPDDYDDFVEIDCSTIVSSYDPNEKSVIPQGLFSQHFIDSTTVLEYTICFQNTGTSPAQNVVIDDIISEYLDIETFHFMGSSHPCNIDILGSNTIRWTFENINLPDSFYHQSASHGFVKFKIGQQAGNQIFTQITNSAAIFFDYNSAVFTNAVINTIGKMDEVVTFKPDINGKQQVKVFPNPAADFVIFKVDSEKYDIELYDTYGRIIRNFKGISSNEYKISTSSISNGVYYYHIKDKTGVIGSGKFVIVE